MKLQMWWRFRLMEVRAAFYQVFDLSTWPIKLLVNWFIFSTLWIWVGFVYMVMVAHRAFQLRKSGEHDALTGKIWWWDQYKLY